MKRLCTIALVALLVGGCAGRSGDGAREARPESTASAIGGSAACSADDGITASASRTVAVELSNYAVVPSACEAPAGKLTFDVSVVGPGDFHEFTVLRTDFPAGELPGSATAYVDLLAEGVELVGSLDIMPVGATETLRVEVEPGKHVLICNYEDHYPRGMYAGFTVA